MDLLKQKYHSPIILCGHNTNEEINCVYDTQNSTFFAILKDNTHLFQDKNGNIWSTVPKTFNSNGILYFPITGTKCNQSDGDAVFFTTKEKVITMATDYFEKFIDPFYGILIVTTGEFFLIEENGNRKKTPIVHQKFKSRSQNEIETYISYN